LAIASATIFLLSTCGGDKGTDNQPTVTGDSWTILNYADGNNNLDYSQGGTSYVIEDVQEMQQVGSSDDVNVIAMVSSIRTGGNAKYYYIEHYPDDLGDNISSTILEDMGGKDMSNPQVLKEFLVYGMTNYPAQNYMVIIDDHGGGWRGACEDDQNGSGNLMSMVDMANAFEGALEETNTEKFGVITYHCCLMSQVEVAYQLRNCADYVVGSEFVMPMESVFGCVEWLGDLVDNPGTTPEDLAKNIVDAVYNAGNDKQKDVHMAATDCSQMGRLASKLDHLATQLTTEATAYWWEVLQAWFSTWVTELDDPAFVDVRDFANNIKQQPNLQNINLVRNAADSVIYAINDAVVMTKTNVPAVTRGGLTIYMPYLYQMFDQSNYDRLDFAAVGWTNFLLIYIEAIEQLINQGYSLTVNISPAGAGTCSVNPDLQSYQAGDTVTITATANSGYTFEYFSDGANNFTDNPFTFLFPDGDVTLTAYFQGGSGPDYATISGTVDWPGHTLSYYTYAFADTIDGGGNVYTYAQTDVDPADGSYTITIEISSAITLYFDAWDDVNYNQEFDSGDGWGYYDPNNNGSWDTNDSIAVSPGDNVTGVDITLQEIALGSVRPRLTK
jgi:hypothetical protein